MGHHSTDCTECGKTFEQDRRGAGRLALTCSPACKADRLRRRDRERHQEKRGDEFFVRQVNSQCKLCGEPSVAKGLCSMHYARIARDGDPGPAEARHKLCTVEGCTEPRLARGWCNMHYLRHLTKGSVGEPERRKRRNGEGSRDPKGYINVTAPGRGKMLEHRFVMEQMLGRALEPFENVHHRNGIRDDNRPDNLELWSKPQLAGQRVEDLVAWIVKQYPEQTRAALTRFDHTSDPGEQLTMLEWRSHLTRPPSIPPD